MASSSFALFISMLLLGGVTCYGLEVGRKMLVEKSVIPLTPTSTDGTRDFMSVIPSTPTRRNDEGQERVRREIDMNEPARMIDCDDVEEEEEEDNQVIMVSSPSITVSKRGTRNFMSSIPSIPTSTVPSIPTRIIHHGSRKILTNRRLIEAKGSTSPTAPGN
ncbi:uncharacterized protein LOC132058913 isoform X3 [Lycium ferocissimum]|uniref:uncharacterized protein LOC132058913 isoform X3 n=1 Tax=Lycium ferocissimum TaxID=112874 RepID=UPI0028157725|nr:uncharacterized protein LOC132058913 isoform X3 [Lycium ferocissimum]